MLELINLSKRFETSQVIDDLSFQAKPGEIFALLGPNGAGKTTTLRMILDIIKPDYGEILYNTIPRAKLTRQLFGYLPEERGLYQRAKVLDLLVYIGMLNQLSKHRAEVEAIRCMDKLGLVEYTNHKVNELSKGIQQKIQLITASMHDPEVLILDEPFVGLDPVNRIVLREIITQYKDEGKIIILSTHQMEEIEKLSDHICLINQGKVILDGNLQEIKKQFQVQTYHIEAEDDLSFMHKSKSIEILEEHNNSLKFSIRN